MPNFQENDFLMHWVEKPGTSLEAMTRITEDASKELRAIPGVKQLRLAHRPRRGRRRGRRAELHRALDQRRPEGRPRQDDGQDPEGHRRLPGPVPRRADLPEGADQGGPHRRRGDGRGPDLRPRHRRSSATRRRRSTTVDEGGPGRDRPEGRAADPRAAARRPAPARGRGPARPDPRRRPPRGDHAGQGAEGRRALQGPEDLRRLRLGRRAGPRRRLAAPQPADRDARWAPTSRWATWPTWRSCPPPTRSSARGPRGGSTSTCNVQGRDLGSVAREIEAKVKRALRSPREYHPEFLGEYAAREESRRRLMALAALSLLGVLLIIHSDFRTVRLTALVFLTLPFALIGGVFGAVLGGGRPVAGLAGRVRDGAGHRRAERDHAGQPLPPPRGGGGRAVRPRPGDPRLGRAAGADPDDGAGDRPGAGAAGRSPATSRATRSSTRWPS